MPQITVTGVLKDFDGDFPTSGTVTFSQSGMFIDTSGAIIPATSETANVSAVDGSFSMTLSSTLDGIPSNISYAVSFTGVIEGAPVTQSLGSIQLAASPSSVLLKDLIIAGIGGGTAVTPTIAAADVSLTLKETDQSLPAGMWRLRVQGDILTLEKNTAVVGDFSTLTEVLRSTATLFTLDIDQRISSAAPRLQWYETDQAADEKFWDIISASKVLTFRTRTDADGAGVTWLQVTRGTGTAVSASEFPGALRALRLGIGAASDGVSAIYSAAAGATANFYALRVIGNSTAGQSFGASIAGGTNSSDFALAVYAQNESTIYFRVRGDGVTIPGGDNTYDFGASGSRWKDGYFGTSIKIGTNPAATGDIRLANNAGITARNAANSGDFQLVRLNTNDKTEFGVSGNDIAIATTLQLGPTPATTGRIRLTNADLIYARNAANSANKGVIGLNASDQVEISTDGQDIKWGRALIALGGGAAPTFGTIGGSGPATAAQNTWMKVIDSSGAAFYVPAWK